MALDRGPGRDPPAPPVAQRGRAAPHGRALLPPRFPAARVRGPARRGPPRSGGQARRRLPRLHHAELSARRRRLGRHGVPVRVPHPQLPATRGPGPPAPDWHGTFAARGALICSFVPRVVDFHPEAIPCPYPHSSVDCDEILFYCRGNFTSRRGVGPGASRSTRPASRTAPTPAPTRRASATARPRSWRSCSTPCVRCARRRRRDRWRTPGIRRASAEVAESRMPGRDLWG